MGKNPRFQNQPQVIASRLKSLLAAICLAPGWRDGTRKGELGSLSQI